MKTSISVLFFDLDGVLIDSLPDITDSVNMILEKNGYSALTQNIVKSLVGKGARYLLRRAFEESSELRGQSPVNAAGEKFEHVYAQYLEYYTKQSAKKTMLYPGVIEMLDTAAQKNIPMSVVSSKPLAVTQAALKYLDCEKYFSCIVGPELVHALKPNPESLEYALNEINKTRKAAGLSLLTARETMLMAGDSCTDIQAGRAFGAKTCAVTGGYGNVSELLAENADYEVFFAGEIIKLL